MGRTREFVSTGWGTLVDGLCRGEKTFRQPPGWMERLNGLYNGGTCFDGLQDGGWERLGGLHNKEERLDDLHDGP